MFREMFPPELPTLGAHARCKDPGGSHGGHPDGQHTQLVLECAACRNPNGADLSARAGDFVAWFFGRHCSHLIQQVSVKPDSGESA
jgi:hypothetical protein